MPERVGSNEWLGVSSASTGSLLYERAQFGVHEVVWTPAAKQLFDEEVVS